MSRYTLSVTRQPTFFLWLAFLLTLLVGSGSALPAAGVWQCQYASEIVAAAPVPGVMPCRMSRRPMPGMRGMACCASRHQVVAPGAHLAAPGCHPTFTPLTAALGTVTEQSRVTLASTMAVVGEMLRGSFSLAPARLTLSERQRPPPDIRLLHSSCLAALCLRGPPSA